jgi:hypothetical protein
MTIFTCIFGDYDTLKEPTIVTKNWRYVCFTNQDLKSNVWEIRKINLGFSDSLLARYHKIMFYRHIEDRYSIYIDGSFQVTCNLDEFWKNNFAAPISCIKHLWRDCLYEEAAVCIEQGRGNAKVIQAQMDHYKEKNLNKHSGLIQSGILLRENCKETNDLCYEWFTQVQQFSSRDQLSFAFVTKDMKINMIENFKYFDNPYFKFTKHNKDLCIKN